MRMIAKLKELVEILNQYDDADSENSECTVCRIFDAVFDDNCDVPIDNTLIVQHDMSNFKQNLTEV